MADILNQTDVDTALAGDDTLSLTDEQRTIVAQVLPQVVAKANVMAEAAKAKEMQTFITKLTEENRVILEAKVVEFRKALTPPTPEELQTMLNQEYVEFSIPLRDRTGARTFTIRELPLSAEQKVLGIVQKTIKARMVEIGQLEWAGAGGSMLEQVEKLMALVPGVLDTVCECCALCLDPYGEQKDITGEWVRENVGSQRLLNIIHAQMEAGRYRDFLSLVSRFTQGPGIQ